MENFAEAGRVNLLIENVSHFGYKYAVAVTKYARSYNKDMVCQILQGVGQVL